LKTLTVKLGERSYPVHVGANLLSRKEVLTPWTADRQVLVVTNTTVAPLYLDTLIASLSARQIVTHVLPDGEQYKTYDQAGQVMDALVENSFARDAVVLALGGGVVGDTAGFAAACFHRGVDIVQIPTTLLALVDSSVGGKTAVNHPLGKNLIGAFHQPVCVLADTQTLMSLPEREFKAGLAEVIKYGLVHDVTFFTWLENNTNALLAREEEALSAAILRSCAIKAEMVARDEKETGQRALLNLGHTFGHAIEAATDYDSWLHGEAVAAGTMMAVDLSCRHGWLDNCVVDRVRSLFNQCNLPIGPPDGLSVDRMLELMGRDKKVLRGALRLVLLEGLGHGVVTAEFDHDLLRQTLTAYTRAA